MRNCVIVTCVACAISVAPLASAQSSSALPGPGSAQRAAAPPAGLSPQAQEVWATETAFAKTMADRSHEGFASFLADETVFLGATILRGKAAVVAGWKRFYAEPSAPFSWRPERVEVLDSGSLAFSTGPVFDPAGARTGTFMSVWRKDADGRWRIVFDTGCPPCGEGS